ncbi:MAG: hypothetical protein CMB80_05420 [Flammeovirgaceae bacterium]|nr:hypothetical protein [Flammeovirgaceae bacterium]|tara:strand:+ start:627 stop:911 length:285 start_codon:yes stop_codon:yes gene_type:complete
MVVAQRLTLTQTKKEPLCPNNPKKTNLNQKKNGAQCVAQSKKTKKNPASAKYADTTHAHSPTPNRKDNMNTSHIICKSHQEMKGDYHALAKIYN